MAAREPKEKKYLVAQPLLPQSTPLVQPPHPLLLGLREILVLSFPGLLKTTLLPLLKVFDPNFMPWHVQILRHAVFPIVREPIRRVYWGFSFLEEYFGHSFFLTDPFLDRFFHTPYHRVLIVGLRSHPICHFVVIELETGFIIGGRAIGTFVETNIESAK